MGAIFRARHRLIGNEVAIKVMLPGVSSERFLREAKVLAKIRSPNVVVVHDFIELADGTPVLVMDWVHGHDLAKVMRMHGGKVGEAEAVKWMIEVCAGMSVAANEGVIHRDLKPSNIMVDTNGVARVMDFGLARGPYSAGLASTCAIALGTPHYMSPEQAQRPESVDTRSDIYSLGATFYHVLTGVPLFDGESAFTILFKHKTEPVISPKTHNPEISNRLSEVIERCVAKSPDDRFQSFHEVADSLKPSIQEGDSPWDIVLDPALLDYLTGLRKNRAKYLHSAAEFDDVYTFPSRRQLRVVTGDIRKQNVDAIVSSDDERLSMSGGVSKAILASAGPQLKVEADRFVPVRQGRVVATSAGKLPQRFVFHAVTLDFSKTAVLLPSRDIIAEIIESCFYQAETLQVTSIAFPLLGTGEGGFSKEVCLDTMIRVLSRILSKRATCVREVTLVVFRDQEIGTNPKNPKGMVGRLRAFFFGMS
jgi:serine/threonine protein kinase